MNDHDKRNRPLIRRLVTLAWSRLSDPTFGAAVVNLCRLAIYLRDLFGPLM
jgi:hypothetical protein